MIALSDIHVWQPKSVEDAWKLKAELAADCRIVAGGTLLRTHWQAGSAAMPRHLVSLDAIPTMRKLEEAQGTAVIGAAVTLAELERHPLIGDRCRPLAAAVKSIAAPSVRRLATLGGNLVSAVGDTLPALLVTEARLEWYGSEGEELEPVGSWLERVRSGAAPGNRLLIRIHIPIQPLQPRRNPEMSFAFYRKIGRREAFIPAVVAVAGTGGLAENGKLRNIRLAAGGGATQAERLTDAEEILLSDDHWSENLPAIHNHIQRQYQACTDPFRSAEYRRITAANLITAELWAIANQMGRGETGYAAYS
ncbi:FAD binding domain-containing protein [Gorillibacterium massiliense]|uniref:FAD binding domain-containing protein n=1 Tax=Gorillibacterium massiliense TaxID=1280390 RepID=UPI0004AE2BC4|nr:FAD binding domain-containing protein [Gorillibacterium massiliense]